MDNFKRNSTNVVGECVFCESFGVAYIIDELYMCKKCGEIYTSKGKSKENPVFYDKNIYTPTKITSGNFVEYNIIQSPLKNLGNIKFFNKSCTKCKNRYELKKLENKLYYSCSNCGVDRDDLVFVYNSEKKYYEISFSQGQHENCLYCKEKSCEKLFKSMFETLSIDELKFVFYWCFERKKYNPVNPDTLRTLDKYAYRGKYNEIDSRYFNILYKFCKSEEKDQPKDKSISGILSSFQYLYISPGQHDINFINNKEKISECLCISISGKKWGPEMYLAYLD